MSPAKNSLSNTSLFYSRRGIRVYLLICFSRIRLKPSACKCVPKIWNGLLFHTPSSNIAPLRAKQSLPVQFLNRMVFSMSILILLNTQTPLLVLMVKPSLLAGPNWKGYKVPRPSLIILRAAGKKASEKQLHQSQTFSTLQLWRKPVRVCGVRATIAGQMRLHERTFRFLSSSLHSSFLTVIPCGTAVATSWKNNSMERVSNAMERINFNAVNCFYKSDYRK